jgi:trans-2,3-dihydro-3-hydroxyanthranilate isomerase
MAEPENEVRMNYTIGQIPVTFRPEEACGIWMRQKAPEFGPFFDAASIAEVLGLKETDVDDRFQAREVTTGVPVIIAPLKTLDAVKAIAMNYPKLASMPVELGSIGILAFASGSESRDNDLHARFFTTLPNIPEDPATGSANGCLASFLVEHKYFGNDAIEVRVEQGYEIGRPSLLFLKASRGKEAIEVNVGGNVVMVADGFLY